MITERSFFLSEDAFILLIITSYDYTFFSCAVKKTALKHRLVFIHQLFCHNELRISFRIREFSSGA